MIGLQGWFSIETLLLWDTAAFAWKIPNPRETTHLAIIAGLLSLFVVIMCIFLITRFWRKRTYLTPAILLGLFFLIQGIALLAQQRIYESFLNRSILSLVSAGLLIIPAAWLKTRELQ